MNVFLALSFLLNFQESVHFALEKVLGYFKFYNSVFLFISLITLGILIVWFIKLNVQTFQPLIVIYRGDNFVYHQWECT